MNRPLHEVQYLGSTLCVLQMTAVVDNADSNAHGILDEVIAVTIRTHAFNSPQS